MEIKAIVGLIPIHFHLKKLSGRYQLQTATLPHNYITSWEKAYSLILTSSSFLELHVFQATTKDQKLYSR